MSSVVKHELVEEPPLFWDFKYQVMCFCVFCMLISSLLPLFYDHFTSFCCFIIIFCTLSFVLSVDNFMKLKRSVLDPELRPGWKSHRQSLPHFLAGRRITSHKQRLTGQRSRRLNSKSLLLTLWLQSRKKAKITSTLLIFLILVSWFEEACGLN